jgi:integrase
MKNKTARAKGTGAVVKNRDRFYLRIKINGQVTTKLIRDEEGNPVKTKRDAERYADKMKSVLSVENKEQLLAEVAIAKKLKSKLTLPLDKLWETYLQMPTRPDSGKTTLQGYLNILTYFLTWLNDKHPDITQAGMITPEVGAEYFAYLTETGVSGRTFNSYRQCLTMVFKHILKKAGLEENPFAEVPRHASDTVSRKEFSAEQVKQIFDCFEEGFWYDSETTVLTKEKKRIRKKVHREYVPMFKDQMRLLIALACWTGCRGEDAATMTWDNVDLKMDIIRFAPKKTIRRTNHEVELPIHPMLHKFLEEAKQWKRNVGGTAYILPDVAIRFQHNPTGVRKDVQKIIHLATGLEISNGNTNKRRIYAASSYSLHSFRHTFVSFCANAGVPLAVVAEIVGHESPSMTKHYTHISNEAKQKAIDSLPQLNGNPDLPAESKRKLIEKFLANASQEQLDSLVACVYALKNGKETHYSEE